MLFHAILQLVKTLYWEKTQMFVFELDLSKFQSAFLFQLFANTVKT